MMQGVAMTTIKNRKGRKRKEGRRKPSGDLILDVSAPPTAIRRLRDAAIAGMHDARWGTELGRLFLNKRLTAEQYNAGCRWETLAIRHRAALGAKSGMPSVCDFGRTNGTPADPDSEAGLLEAKRHLADMARYQAAYAAVAKHGRTVTYAVTALCEESSALHGEGLAHAIVGLNSLADHFGLTNQRKS